MHGDNFRLSSQMHDVAGKMACKEIRNFERVCTRWIQYNAQLGKAWPLTGVVAGKPYATTNRIQRRTGPKT